MTMTMNKEVKFDDFQIIPIPSSAKRLKISDETYFSSQYSNYVSNSRLRWINPDQGGSWQLFQNPPRESTHSLALGSCIHECVLQSEEFQLPPDVSKPTAKLGKVIDYVIKNRKAGLSIYDSIKSACESAEYYLNTWENKIHYIIAKGLKYYFEAKDLPDNSILLDPTTRENALASINSINTNINIQQKLHPVNELDEPIQSYNEDALFLDLMVVYKDRATTVRLKMKADNWSVDPENKVLTLNDLKTTSKPIGWFMRDYGSLIHYRYYRQFYFYGMVLQEYCKIAYGFNIDWDFNCNVLVVETFGEHKSECFRINETLLQKGKREFEELIKRVAYYQLNPNETEPISFA